MLFSYICFILFVFLFYVFSIVSCCLAHVLPFKTTASAGKVMPTVFLDVYGVVHAAGRMPGGETCNCERYCGTQGKLKTGFRTLIPTGSSLSSAKVLDRTQVRERMLIFFDCVSKSWIACHLTLAWPHRVFISFSARRILLKWTMMWRQRLYCGSVIIKHTSVVDYFKDS
jgi:hypothetical protein